MRGLYSNMNGNKLLLKLIKISVRPNLRIRFRFRPNLAVSLKVQFRPKYILKYFQSAPFLNDSCLLYV